MAGKLFERIVESAASATTRLRVRSSLNPMLWLCGIISTTCFVIAGAIALVTGDYQQLVMALVLIGAIPVFATCGLAVYFAIHKPENLRSEDYQIRHDALNLIKEKGSLIDVAPSSLEAITNPNYQNPVKNG